MDWQYHKYNKHFDNFNQVDFELQYFTMRKKSALYALKNNISHPNILKKSVIKLEKNLRGDFVNVLVKKQLNIFLILKK